MMGDAVPQTPWDFSLWTGVAGGIDALSSCIWTPLPYNELARVEGRATQGCDSSATSARSGRRPYGRLADSPAHHLRNAVFLSNQWGPPQNLIVQEDPTSAQLIRPFLRGRDIKRWNSEWADQWHIVIPSSHNHKWPWSDTSDEQHAERVFADTYPSVYKHLKTFEEKLRGRSDKGAFWWELRSCDYYQAFEEPKIVVQCIAYFSRFAIDTRGHIVNNKVLFLPTGDLYLLGILNSRISWWIINRTFQHMKDDGLSIDVQFLLALPVPIVHAELREAIAETVRSLVAGTASSGTTSEVNLNRLVERAFGLGVEERQTLEASLPARDPIVSLGITEASIAERTIDDSAVTGPINPVGVQAHRWPSIVLQTVAAGAWSTPQAVAPESLALLTLVEVMRAFSGNASQAQVRLAATLVRKPAHALAFLEAEQAREWVRVIGNDARPLPPNVFNISHFRPAAADQPWASAVAQLTATGAMTASGDRWIIGSNFPASSGEPWVAGRAAFAVDLVSKVVAADLEERMTAFLRSVEDGTARLAVS